MGSSVLMEFLFWDRYISDGGLAACVWIQYGTIELKPAWGGTQSQQFTPPISKRISIDVPIFMY